MRLWRAKQRKPSLGSTDVFEGLGFKFSVSVDKATLAWVIDLEFPSGGPKPDFVNSLKYVSVLPEKRTATNRRFLSIKYDPTGNDCVEFWPHFAEAILTEAAATEPKSNCAQSIARTFLKWKKLWPSSNGLSDAMLLGLFGELTFLRSLSKTHSSETAVVAWQGASARDHDFSAKGIAFEVKASKGNGRKVTISNLHQLDDAGVDALYLVHVRLRASDDKVHSLQSLGEGIKAAMATNSQLLTKFNDKLGKAGWFKASKEQRDSTGFRVIGRSVYHVTKDFPRILRRDILERFKPGVDLKTYKVKLALAPEPLGKIQEDELWERLRTPEAPLKTQPTHSPKGLSKAGGRKQKQRL